MTRSCGTLIDTSKSTSYSFRDETRHSSGYSWEHCLFAKGAGLYAKAEEMGYKVTQDAGKTYGLNFAEDGTPADGETANKIEILMKHDGHTKQTTMTYDEATGKYIYTQYGTTADEVAVEDRETFENVFIMMARVYNDEVYHVADLDGSGEGYYACNGKIIPIQWHHENAADPFTFTLADGTPLEQGIGTSYIAIAPLKSEISWE